MPENSNLFKRTCKSIGAAFAVLTFSAVLFCSCGKPENDKPIIKPINEQDKLVIYTSHKPEVYTPVIKEFESRTGIWVEVFEGGTTELMEDIYWADTEFTCDVMFGGGIESYNAYKDCFVPYRISANWKIRKQDRSDEYVWTPFTELPIVIIYNKKLVSSNEAPKGWIDILDSKWKGNIAFANPLNSGSSYTILATIDQVLSRKRYDPVGAFVGNLDYKVLGSSGSVVAEVSEGSCLIGVTLEETALKAIENGSPITIVYPVEGTSAVADAAAIVKGAAHEDNARKFLEFIAGYDMQRQVSENMYRRSVREDVSNSTYETVNIIEYDVSKATTDRETILETWNKRAVKDTEVSNEK